MTIKQIAKLSGVGTSTVSRYLNNGYVSEEKRTKIKKVIDDYNYIPNDNARELKSGSKRVNIIVPRITSYTASKFLEGAIEQANKNNLNCVIHNSGFDKVNLNKLIKDSISKNDYATIVFSFTDLDTANYENNNILLVGQKSNNYNYIYIDSYNYIQQLLNEIIIKNNYKNITYVGTNFEDKELQNRKKSVYDFCLKNNIHFEYENATFEDKLDFKLKKDTFYFCMSDKKAYEVYMLSKKQKLQLSRDFLLAGFGNYEYSKILKITSIGIDYFELGKQSINKISNNADYSEKIDVKIHYRDSTTLI